MSFRQAISFCAALCILQWATDTLADPGRAGSAGSPLTSRRQPCSADLQCNPTGERSPLPGSVFSYLPCEDGSLRGSGEEGRFNDKDIPRLTAEHEPAPRERQAEERGSGRASATSSQMRKANTEKDKQHNQSQTRWGCSSGAPVQTSALLGEQAPASKPGTSTAPGAGGGQRRTTARFILGSAQSPRTKFVHKLSSTQSSPGARFGANWYRQASTER